MGYHHISSFYRICIYKTILNGLNVVGSHSNHKIKSVKNELNSLIYVFPFYQPKYGLLAKIINEIYINKKCILYSVSMMERL